MLKTTIIYIILVSSLFNYSQAQVRLEDHFSMRQYTDVNGLPQNSVKRISSDAEGFIWLATENGLVRFDGQQFFIFDQSNLPISSNRFYMLQPDMNGVEATKRSGNRRRIYAVADGDQYVRIENGIATRDSLYFENRIRHLPFISEGRNTFITSGLPNYLDITANPDYYIIPIEGKGNFFLCYHHKVAFYSNWKKSYEVKFAAPLYWNFFGMGNELCFRKDNGKICKIGRSGVTEFQLAGDILKNPGYMIARSGSQIYWNNVSDQVFIYFDKKLYLVEKPVNGKMETRLLLDGFDFESSNIKTVHVDMQSNRIFLGSLTKGLFVLTPKPFYTVRAEGGDMENVFYAQTAFGSNAVLTPTGIILGIDKGTGALVRKKLPAIRAVNVSDNYSLLTDHKKFLWVKSGDHLVKFDQKGEKVIKDWDLKDEIKQIYQGKDGAIWVGMRMKGLYRIDPDDPLANPELFIKEPFHKTWYILSETEDMLMIGTEHGLYRVQISSRNVSLVQGTEKMTVNSLHIPRPGEIWFTAYQDGLFLYADHKLVRFPLDRGRYLTSAHFIVEDSTGYFWVPTNKGLFQIYKKDLLHFAKYRDTKNVFYMYYTKDQGFNTNEFNGGCEPCAVRLDNGYLSLSSLNGLVWFVPEQVKPTVPDGAIILDKLEVRNVSLPVDKDTLYLPLSPKQVMLHMTTPYFGDINNLDVSYALVEGNRKINAMDWQELKSEDLSIVFSSLDAGNYKLYIRKLNGFGANNYTYRTLTLIVPPAWYETWLFRLCCFLLVLSGIYYYTRLRIKYIEAQNRKLELTIKKRTSKLNLALSELEDSKNQMGQQLHLLSRLLTSMTHDIQSPLNFINITSKRIPRMVNEAEYDSVIEIGEGIAYSSRRMSGLLNDLLDYIKVQVYGNRMKFEEVNLHALIKSKYEVFASVIQQKHNTFLNELPTDLTVHSDYQMLAIIVHNLIDNASKFAENGVIKVFASVIDGYQHLIICNTGGSMPTEAMKILNSSAEDPSLENALVEGRGGLGLLIVKEIAMLIQLRLWVENTGVTSVHLIFESPVTDF